ncbi:hypothetical protein [Ciceribacter azotifigens]|uniref:hypothetical protein n=1 Tax=Ciceribacter azotifigens TaxID=2069303 RepID=UPI003A885633
MTKAKWIGGGLVRMFCALAVLSLAFAHKPPQVMAASIENASYVLPDGSYADLCVGDVAVKHPSASGFCEACILAAATLLPAPPEEGWLLSAFASLDNQPVFEGHYLGPESVERPRSRAPPVFA